MKKLSFTLKIILIFSIPAIALIYFSFVSMNKEYAKLQQNSINKLSVNITNSLNKVLHNLQIERGFSAGYIVAKQKNRYKDKLNEQYKKTDNSIEELLKYIKDNSKEKQALVKILGYKNKPIIKDILYKLKDIKLMRKKVQNSDIDFNTEIQYYTFINEHIIEAISSFADLLKNNENDSFALIKLQLAKENAGLERAYIYNQLLSATYNKEHTKTIKRLIEQQNFFYKEFYTRASIHTILIYDKTVDTTTLNKIADFRKRFFAKQLSSKDAQQWFELSTKRINQLEQVSTQMLQYYIDVANKSYENALKSLYFTAFLWIFSNISLIFLTYILNRLVKKEDQYKEELRISSYSFDSHEAMTITDVNGVILKVNKAFSEITGYDADDVIGQNPRVLKSKMHTNEFYKNMWHSLQTEGRWSGEIYNKKKNGDIYLEMLSITAIKNEKNITTHYIAQFLDISDIKKAQEDAEHQANHDFLTSLLNRKSLTERLQEEFVKAKRHNFLHSFIFIDLDNFKNINDNYGHGIGDILLVQVSQRLRESVRDEDIIARMSGDEFAIIILNLDKPEQEAAKDVQDICRKLLKNISRPYYIDEHKLEITSSIGIKLFPDGELNVNDVIVHADTAMYQAKNQGKNQFIFFDYSIELQMQQFIKTEKEIKSALTNNMFEFYYQPKVDVKTSKITGAEMLIRWNHTKKGLLSPESFIDVSRDIGVIENFTKLALESASEFLNKHKNSFDGTLSINISSIELLKSEFEADITEFTQRNKIDPKMLEFEITETDLVSNFNTIVNKIKNLQNLGFKFSIDDFGTGYSSLTYLQKLPVNTLKIDKEFFENLHIDSNKELVKLMVKMAKTFDMDIVAEGIENTSQLEFIKELDIEIYQGFYMSHALREDDFIKLFQKHS